MIEARNVSKWFGTFKVLTDISQNVRKGRAHCHLRTFGSGKSTLIRCFNRLEAHKEGEIVVNGVRLHS
ncbi:ATP-binding cassette domain-containing protein [Bradyrhizobium sp. CW9]|uniref:ATP-binding cassette domain-containing protein n=1 Tax=Bradyrhizobium sp. CW9 TaxID=2782689 RepID=UPI003211E928